METPEDFAAMGSLLGRLHSTPTDWFDKHREAFLSTYPKMQAFASSQSLFRDLMMSKVPVGDWVNAVLTWRDDKRIRDESWTEADLVAAWELLVPRNKVLARLVNTHNDFHRGNMVKLDDGTLKFVDLDTVCVAPAHYDLGMLLQRTIRGSCEVGAQPAKDQATCKRAALRAYLREFGEDSSDLAIDDLLLEIELYSLFHLKCHNSELPTNEVQKSRDCLDRARSSPDIRRILLEVGNEGILYRSDVVDLVGPTPSFPARSPRALVVTGAGMAGANGKYVLDLHAVRTTSQGNRFYGVKCNCQGIYVHEKRPSFFICQTQISIYGGVIWTLNDPRGILYCASKQEKKDAPFGVNMETVSSTATVSLGQWHEADLLNAGYKGYFKFGPVGTGPAPTVMVDNTMRKWRRLLSSALALALAAWALRAKR